MKKALIVEKGTSELQYGKSPPGYLCSNKFLELSRPHKFFMTS